MTSRCKILVTGASGFVAGHVIDFVRAEAPDTEVFGVVRHGAIDAARGAHVTAVPGDLEDAASTDALFDRVEPDRIVHLAAQSSVHRSWESPQATLGVNVQGLLNILEALRRRKLTPRVARGGQRGGVRRRAGGEAAGAWSRTPSSPRTRTR